MYILREGHFPKAKTSLSGMLSPKKKRKAGGLSWGLALASPSCSLLPTCSSFHSFFSITPELSTRPWLFPLWSQSLSLRIALLHLICSLTLTTIETDHMHLLPCLLSLSLQKKTRSMTVRSYLFYLLLYPRVNRISRCLTNEST